MTAPAVESATPAIRPPAWLFWFAVGVLSIWLGLVAWLTWTSSNPVTLNRQQIFASDVLLVGRVSSQHVVEPVEDQPWPLADRSPIKIVNLSRTHARPGRVFLFPLRFVLNRIGTKPKVEYMVTPSELPSHEPLVYPATPETMDQLRQILQEPRTSLSRKAVTLPRSPTARD